MKRIIFNLIFMISLSKCVIVPSIPTHLLDCYRSGGPDLPAPRRLDVFLSLLRKMELNSQLDMRLFSTSLLRSLRLDGIEQLSTNAVETDFILPYRASNFQIHKYKLLMDLFLPSQNLLQVEEILPVAEKCFLHRMLSSTVRQWERGDESVVCPVSAQQSQNMETENSGRISSRCPIEDGVIQTRWGTISPGTLVAAIAASLESQRVSVTDILNANIFKEDVAEPLMVAAKQEWFENIETLKNDSQSQRQTVDVADIGNVWVATLAGDLAEVVVNQGPRVGANPQSIVIGSQNRWNDTWLPRNHYIFPKDPSVIDWHFTDAEILAGIDGFIISTYLPQWIAQRGSLRLSQVIDMYYSDDGISFEPTVKACNRETLFGKIFRSEDLVTETTRFAHVLSLRQIIVYIPVEEMQRIAEAAVSAFSSYVSTLLNQNHRSCQVNNNIPYLDLVVATDGSMKGYEVQQIMSWIGGSLEISQQRSTISLLHGNTGQWIAPPSHNLTTMYSYISNYTGEWPNRLNLPNVVSTILRYSLNQSLTDIANNASIAPSTVVLILSPSDRPSATELERARDLMATLRTTYFDTYFAYVAEEVTDFQNVNNEYLDYSELFITSASSSVQDVIDAIDTYLVRYLNVPKRFLGVQCPFNGTEYTQVEFEDFVMPNHEASYRIHPFYLRQTPLIQVQFRNDGQGQLMACMWRGAEESHSCQTIMPHTTHTFNMTTPCPSPEFCTPAHFTTTAISSNNICAHNDCRFPNEVGYRISHSGLRCLPLKGISNIVNANVILISVVLVMYYMFQ